MRPVLTRPLRAKLRNLLAAIEELNPWTRRDGPHTILERFLELNDRPGPPGHRHPWR